MKLFDKGSDFFSVFFLAIDVHFDYSVPGIALGFDARRNKTHKLNGSSGGLMSAVICGTKYHSLYMGVLFQFLPCHIGFGA